MATTKNITMKQFNGSDYDTLYPKTQSSQIIGSIPIASGGTGGTNATSGMYNLLNGMSAITPATNDLFPFKDVSGSTSGLVTLTNLITAMGNNGVITTSNLSTQASNLGFSKIQTGSYVGTGTYGESNPCSLTFDFAPKLFFMIGRTVEGNTSNDIDFYFLNRSGGVLLINFDNMDETYRRGHGIRYDASDQSSYTFSKKVSNTYYWYNMYKVDYQFNNSKYRYFYTYIG